jgi:hypothetical protein
MASQFTDHDVPNLEIIQKNSSIFSLFREYPECLNIVSVGYIGMYSIEVRTNFNLNGVDKLVTAQNGGILYTKNKADICVYWSICNVGPGLHVDSTIVSSVIL